jgi:hypothetical protein
MGRPDRHNEWELNRLRSGPPTYLHPDYANVLFREALGMTLSDYLLEHRIARAQRMPATTDEGCEHRVRIRLRLDQPVQRGRQVCF